MLYTLLSFFLNPYIYTFILSFGCSVANSSEQHEITRTAAALFCRQESVSISEVAKKES